MFTKRSSGILLHPTSLPSPFGIGDMGKEAYKFIDFLAMSDVSLWQILPLNPTSFGNSPYQSFSTFAGNFLLISPELLVEEGYLEENSLQNIPPFSKNKIEYDNVISYKTNLFLTAFENFTKTKTSSQNSSFEKFCEKNKFWLEDYCLFMALKEFFIEDRKNNDTELEAFKSENKTIASESLMLEYFYGGVLCTWPKNIKRRKSSALASWSKKLSKQIDFHKFLQYEFYRQWDKLKEYSNENNVQIVGDIPIYVSLDSADVWTNPDIFQLDKNLNPTSVAGVPPDYFSETGQLWGNPLYNWNVMEKNNFDWWMKRINYTLQNVDIVRIDHFRGFEDYWAVPASEETAINGKWFSGPSDKFFTALQNTLGTLPIIAEDLGILTDEVTALRKKFNLPGMKILQFAFSNNQNEYLPHNFSDDNSVVYTGTHDNNTTKGWYETLPEEEKDYIRRYMNIDGSNISWDLIRLAFASSAKTAIIQAQDLLSLDATHRMNTPGTCKGNWEFRMLENSLTEQIKDQLIYLNFLFNRKKITPEITPEDAKTSESD